jgi:hypothetical protein
MNTEIDTTFYEESFSNGPSFLKPRAEKWESF